MEPRHDAAPPPREAPEKAAAARRFCEELLGRLGGEIAVEAKDGPEAIAVSLTPREGNALELSSGLVEALQTLVNRVANPLSEGRKWVNLEVGGFTDQGDPAVRAMVERLAATVKRTGRAVAIAPMSARERRQVHLLLAGLDGVASRSDGEGIFRQLVVLADPSKKAEPRE